MLKTQDIVLALKLLCKGKENWSQGGLAQEIVISAAEVNAGIKRLSFAKLIEKQEDGRRWQVIKPAMEEFLLHGIKYVFPAQKGAPAVGLPTAHAVAPLKLHLTTQLDYPPVWPSKQGKIKGYGFVPLYPTVAQAAMRDAELYEWLSIVDALRDTDNEEPDLARLCLKDKLAGRLRVINKEKKQQVPKDDNQLDLLSL